MRTVSVVGICWIWAVWGVSRSCAQATLTLVPVGGTTVIPGQIVAVEAFVQGHRTIRFESGQWDLPCTVLPEPGGSGTLTATGGCTDCDGNGTHVSTGGGAALFGNTGIYAYQSSSCISSDLPPVGQTWVAVAAGVTRYLGTVNYQVSASATGTFTLFFECTDQPGGVCDSGPEGTNTTRFHEDGGGTGLLGLSMVGTTLRTPPPTPTTTCTSEGAGDCRSRNLTFTMVPPATATGGAGSSAIKVTMVDLENPNPVNNNPTGPCCPPGNFITFDTAVNSVCAGGTDQGYRCPPSTCPDGICPAGVGCSEAGPTPGGVGGCARWVGPPLGYLESNDNPGLGNYRAARLQCLPFYYDWTAEPNGGLVNVMGAEIVPSSTYQLQAYGSSCKGSESSCTNVSPAVNVATRRAGDIATPFQGGPPLTQPNAIDVTNAVNKFRNLAGSPPKLISQVQPNFPDPNSDINAIDIVTVVDNQRGFGYTYSGPCACPSTVPCNTTACAGASACTGLYGAGATCIKTCSSGPRTGQPCNNNLNCGACIGGPLTGAGAAGIPCDANADCASGNCGVGVCPTGATPGFCRDRCGRCN